MFCKKSLSIFAISFLLPAIALSASKPNLMSAEYCNGLVESVKISSGQDNVKRIRQQIELCSASPYLKEHVKSGKAVYTNTNTNYTAKSGDYYCSLVPQAREPGQQSGLQASAKVNLKCGLRSKMHASVIESTKKERELEAENSQVTTEMPRVSPFTKDTSPEVLKLAITQAKLDLENVSKLSAYFKKRAHNTCADLLLNQLNNYYDPLKKDTLARFRFPGTKITKQYTRWDCNPKSFDAIQANITPDIEDQTYAASTLTPLIEKNIKAYEGYLAGETTIPGISQDSNLHSAKGVEVKVDLSSIVKVFFHKDSFCSVLKTSEVNIYNLSCLSKLEDGFEQVSWFNGMPDVSHLGICALEPVSEAVGFSSRLYQYFEPSGTSFKSVPPKKENELKRTPKNLNEIANIKCVTDVKTKNVVSQVISTTLKEDIAKIAAGITYDPAKATLEVIGNAINAELLKRNKPRFPKINEIKLFNGSHNTQNGLVFTLDIKKPQIITSNGETCVGYGLNVRAGFVKDVSINGRGPGYGVSLGTTGFTNPIGDYIFSYKNCSTDIIGGNIVLAQDAMVMAGGKIRYFKSVPNPAAFMAKVDRSVVKKFDSFDFSFAQGRNTEMNLLKHVKTSETEFYFLNSKSQSGVYLSSNYRANNIGQVSKRYNLVKLNKETGNLDGSYKKARANASLSVNYCSSSELAANSCCFGLVEGAKSCDLKPLEVTKSILAGTAAGTGSQTSGSSLDFLQNMSADCLKIENKETEACKKNKDMVALGFISYLMEQYFQKQSELMFQNFLASMQMPGANVQAMSQASNLVSMQNTQQQANSMLGLYYQSVTGSEEIPTSKTAASAGQTSPAPSELPTNSIFGQAFAAPANYVPFPSGQASGALGSWLPSGGNYGIARDVASQIAILQNGINQLTSQVSLLPITSSERAISGFNVYPSSGTSGVSFPQSYYQARNVSGSGSNYSASPSLTGANTNTRGQTISREALISHISSLEVLTTSGQKVDEIGGVLFPASETAPSLYEAMNYTVVMELLAPHYSTDKINVILDKAF